MSGVREGRLAMDRDTRVQLLGRMREMGQQAAALAQFGRRVGAVEQLAAAQGGVIGGIVQGNVTRDGLIAANDTAIGVERGRVNTAVQDIADVKAGLLALAGMVPIFIQGSPFTFAALPNPANYIGQYAQVTDLFDATQRDTVIATMVLINGSMVARWKALRPPSAIVRTVTADTTLQYLKSATTQFMTIGVGAGLTRKINLSETGVVPGVEFELAMDLTLGLGGGLQILGVVGGTLSFLTGALGLRRRFVYADGWRLF